VEFYNTTYRESWYDLNLNGKVIDTIIDFDRTITGFQRFKSFYEIIESNSQKYPDLIPKKEDTIMDVGGYQGAFLSAAVQIWNCSGMVYDYSKNGVDFSKRTFGFDKSRVVENITLDEPVEKVRFVTSIHSFEP